MISGGGTGGHIYPAISIAQALKDTLQDVDLLFVGAKGKMEMTRVPEAGFKIEGLWISGMQRSFSMRNIMFPLKLVFSVWKSFALIRKFKPDAVVGVGGYASGPLLYAATVLKIPTLIQEQNFYAGRTNKWLSGSVNRICVAHKGLEKYFPVDKLVVTGNPVRKTILPDVSKKQEAYAFFGLDPNKRTLLVLGGSLGARSVNEFVLAGYRKLMESGIQVIWQTGGFYFEEMTRRVGTPSENIKMVDFLKEMHYAYAVADLVISRAGALSIAELMLTGKPSVLVPSPNVAEDHQTINAMALADRDAAVMVSDRDGMEKLIDTALALMDDEEKRRKLAENIKSMARPDAARDIANEIIKMIA